MQASRDRILTSHAGSLPRPDELIEANRAREAEGAGGDAGFGARLRAAVADVVRRQVDLGISAPGDGEFGKSMGHRVNYRAWWSYSFQRLGGLELGTTGLYDMPPRRSRPGEVVLSSFADRRDRLKFAAAYADPDSGITTGPRPATWPVCVAPLTYTGHDAIRSDIANFKAALDAPGVEEGFMTSIAPGSASRIANRFYRTEEEFLFIRGRVPGFRQVALYRHRDVLRRDGSAQARLLPAVAASAELFDVLGATPLLGRTFRAGGYVGEWIGGLCQAYLNRPGAIIVVLTLLALAVILSTQFSFGRTFHALFETTTDLSGRGISAFRSWREERRREAERREVIAKHTRKNGPAAGAEAATAVAAAKAARAKEKEKEK